ncbi:MAG: phosphatidate cytidylyltransferase, partial [Bacteroidota bacterium]
MSNLTQRILVALVTIPLIVFLCMLGGFYFFAMIVLISSLGLHEYYKLAEKKGASPQIALGLIFGFLVTGVFIWENLQYVVLSIAAKFGRELPTPTMAQL